MEHAINFGDIGRILETILLVLLDPSTSRIAIHYISVQNEKKNKKSQKTKTNTNNTKQRNSHSSSSFSKQKKTSLEVAAKQQFVDAGKTSLDNETNSGNNSAKEVTGNQADTITTDDKNAEFGGGDQEENNPNIDNVVEGSSGDQDETATITKSRTQSEVSSNGFADDEEDDIEEDDEDEEVDSDVSDDDVIAASNENIRKGWWTFFLLFLLVIMILTFCVLFAFKYN